MSGARLSLHTATATRRRPRTQGVACRHSLIKLLGTAPGTMSFFFSPNYLGRNRTCSCGPRVASLRGGVSRSAPPSPRVSAGCPEQGLLPREGTLCRLRERTLAHVGLCCSASPLVVLLQESLCHCGPPGQQLCLGTSQGPPPSRSVLCELAHRLAKKLDADQTLFPVHGPRWLRGRGESAP